MATDTFGLLNLLRAAKVKRTPIMQLDTSLSVVCDVRAIKSKSDATAQKIVRVTTPASGQ